MPFSLSKIIKLLIAALLLCVSNSALANSSKSTLYSGYYDDYLMIVADKESRALSGYYNDGKCRLYFQGPLQIVELYQRKDFGEAYMPNAMMVGASGGEFSIEIYSRAKGGFREQISIEPGSGSARKLCRSRISLDRASSVGDSFVAVRVVSKSRVKLYQIQRFGSETRLVRDRKTKSPERFSGIWIAKTYSSSHSPAGYHYVNWYAEDGTPLAAYIKIKDLYPAN